MSHPLRTLVLVSGTLLPLAVASAGAPPRTAIPAGTGIRVWDISPDDALHGKRARLVGQECKVASPGLVPAERIWFTGGVDCDDGQHYAFHQFTFALTSELAAPAEAGCPEGAFSGSGIAEGATVKILAVSGADAFSDRADTLVGLEGKVRGDLHNQRQDGSCWFGGGFVNTTDDGEHDYYFYEVAVSLEKEPPKRTAPIPDGRSCPGSASTAGSLAHGQKVKILAISPDDAYYSTRSRDIGKTGTVDGELFQTTGPCWMGGGMMADDGTYYYFYKAAVKAVGGVTVAPGGDGCPAGVYTSSSLSGGRRVKLVEVHPDDAYYSTRYSIIGLTGSVDGDLHQNAGPCWMGGGFADDTGGSYYFYKAAFVDLGAGGGPAPRSDLTIGYTGSSVSLGSRFTILDVHPEDAYYDSRWGIIGKTCINDDVLSSVESGFFAGPVACTDGSEYYFYKVSLNLK